MTRASFELISGVPLGSLQLDTKNPRIRFGQDQQDSIARLLRKPKQLLALAKDIATNGLSTAPILVEPLDNGEYVVWDGNRRVTALKLMNSPELAPTKAISTQFAAVAAKAAVPLPDAIDVLASRDRQALFLEVVARHGGGKDGAGQLTWDTLLRTIFLLGHGVSSEYRLAGLLLMWAEEHGIEVDEQFPISTIHRFLNRARLRTLGFNDLNNAVAPWVPPDVAVQIADRIVRDFGPGGEYGVNEVFQEQQQDEYVRSILQDVGLADGSVGAGGSEAGNQSDSGRPKVDGKDAGGDGDEPDTEAGAPTGRPRRARAPAAQKADYDRKSVVRARYKPSIPDDLWKAREVLRELRNLDTAKSPIAAAALFRAFFEMSTRSYIKRHKIELSDKMHRNAQNVARHMREFGRLDPGELDAASRRFKDRSQAESLLQYNTLNDYMHSLRAMPDRQSLHVLWTEVEPYLEACWDDARRPG